MPIYVQEPIVVGDTPDFILTAQKDGVVWNLTGATVTLTLYSPIGTVLGPYTATISNPTGGVAHYQVPTDTILDPGDWHRRWVCVQGGIRASTRKKVFSVEP